MWEAFWAVAESLSMLNAEMVDDPNGQRIFNFEAEVHVPPNDTTTVCVACIDKPDRVVIATNLLNVPTAMNLECIRRYFTSKNRMKAAQYLVEPDDDVILLQIVILKGGKTNRKYFEDLFASIHSEVVTALNNIEDDLDALIDECLDS